MKGLGGGSSPTSGPCMCGHHNQTEDSDELNYLTVVVQRMMNEFCKHLSEESFCRHILDCTDSYFRGHVEGILK